MLNAQDQEKVTKSVQAANLLVQDLRELVKADDPLLAHVAMEILQQTVLIEDKLKRIESATRPEVKPAKQKR